MDVVRDLRNGIISQSIFCDQEFPGKFEKYNWLQVKKVSGPSLYADMDHTANGVTLMLTMNIGLISRGSVW